MTTPIINTIPGVMYSASWVQQNSTMATVLLALLIIYFVYMELYLKRYLGATIVMPLSTYAGGDASSKVGNYVRDDRMADPYTGYTADKVRLDELTAIKKTRALTDTENTEYLTLYAKVSVSSGSGTYVNQVFDDYNPSGPDGKPVPSTACALYTAEMAAADIASATYNADTSAQGAMAQSSGGKIIQAGSSTPIVYDSSKAATYASSETMTDNYLRKAAAGLV